MEYYQYEPIDLATDAIRLVRLFKGNFYDPICCDVFQAYLSTIEGIPYEALSYTWGVTTELCDMTLQGKRFRITGNLEEALRYLRLADQDRVLWVDAMCINQCNNAEKGHQVGQMRLVYETAEAVLVWLGPGNDDVSALMTFAQEFHRRSLRNSGWRKEASSLLREHGGPNTDLHRRRERGVQFLLAQRWFSRVWVLQEVASARSAAIVVGRKSVSTRSFTWLLRYLNVKIEPHAQAVLDIMPGTQRNTSWWSKDRDLLTLLRKFRSSEATDPRDLVYALLGIASDACKSSILRPDYEITFRQLIQKAVAYLLFGDESHGGVFTCPAWDEKAFLAARDRLEYNLFLWAIENGSSQLALSLAKRYDMDPNCTMSPGQPLLCFLVQDITYRKKMLLAVVLDHKRVNVNIEDEQKDTPLSLAISRGSFASVELLLARHDINVNTARGSLGPPLVAAMLRNSDINIQEYLPGPYLPGPYLPGLAISTRHRWMEEMILNRDDVDVNLRDGIGISPLDIAAARGDMDLVQLLLDKGATTHPLPRGRNFAMCSAAERGFVDIIQLLLSHHADVDGTGARGVTPLWMAAFHGQLHIVKLLAKDHHAKINNSGGPEESTPLFEASRRGHEDVVKVLLTLGASVSSRTTGSDFPLLVATEKGHIGVVSLLLRYGADPMAEDARGRTALTCAVDLCRNSQGAVLVGRLRDLRNLLVSKAHEQGVEEGKLQRILHIINPSWT